VRVGIAIFDLSKIANTNFISHNGLDTIVILFCSINLVSFLVTFFFHRQDIPPKFAYNSNGSAPVIRVDVYATADTTRIAYSIQSIHTRCGIKSLEQY